ncbi:transcriptional regulator [Agaricicola taiwanensis]|uniref:Transcriptional regulator n=1 Tax=Agaricicola taiwanensis TaxID=591372 RepID=A0A8J2VLS5_9RHOB|nr:helix-turn-helix domain-containing protein [Agaricicola taiwanensis]GGE30487.1 transcriptional regulator [Agaricicola taiwanensis]
MSFRSGEEVHGEGEAAEMLYRVTSGAVRAFNMRQDGRRQIEGFYLPGDIFGLDVGATHHVSAEATMNNTYVVAIWRSTLEEVAARDASLGREVLQLINLEWRRARYHALLLGQKSAIERIAGFLLDVARRQGSDCVASLPMSRIDIADYLGLTIETVSRTLTQLERERIIAMPSLRQVRIVNRSALIAWDV